VTEEKYSVVEKQKNWGEKLPLRVLGSIGAAHSIHAHLTPQSLNEGENEVHQQPRTLIYSDKLWFLIIDSSFK
jgi:hypothetical protein